jgi:hypothetical protein
MADCAAKALNVHQPDYLPVAALGIFPKLKGIFQQHHSNVYSTHQSRLAPPIHTTKAGLPNP